MTDPTSKDELRHEIHMAMLGKADTATAFGEMTVVPLGFAVSIAQELIEATSQRARIAELEAIKPPEQYKDFAKIAGRDTCVICGFNSELFRKHIDDRIAVLSKKGDPNGLI